MSARQLLPLLYLLLSLCTLQAHCAGPTEIIRYPRPMALVDPHGDYILELLQQALKNYGARYQLAPSAARMQQARAIYEMTNDTGGIDLLWTMSTDDREAQLIPIRIPIDKGLIGWRIPLVSGKNSKLLSHVRTGNDLAAYRAGQEHDWPDVPILKSNGLPVITSTSYEPLFSMLEAGRFDYFPRSIFEIWNEYASHPKHHLHIDESIILHYPSAYYFFVTRRHPRFAEDLRNGLEEMIKSGDFERIFQKYHHASIKNANIRQRVVIELHNPLLNPDRLPRNRNELWYRP